MRVVVIKPHKTNALNCELKFEYLIIVGLIFNGVYICFRPHTGVTVFPQFLLKHLSFPSRGLEHLQTAPGRRV